VDKAVLEQSAHSRFIGDHELQGTPRIWQFYRRAGVCGSSPSRDSTATAQLVEEAGFPEVVNILTGFGETAGAALAAHPDVDKVAFTGSTEVGKLIVQAAAGNLKKVSLELGGKSPAIVFPDADMDVAVSATSSAIFFNMGQCCTAGSRLYAHKRVFDRLMQSVADRAGKIRVGHGLDPQTQLGPLVSDEQFKRVTGYLEAGRQGRHRW
jgi:phenylacetaldehyde dehydrogenase